MRWRTRVRTEPKRGDTKRTLAIAWRPAQCCDGYTVWLRPVEDKWEYRVDQKYDRYYDQWYPVLDWYYASWTEEEAAEPVFNFHTSWGHYIRWRLTGKLPAK